MHLENKTEHLSLLTDDVSTSILCKHVIVAILDEIEDNPAAEDERDDDADVSDEDLEGDGDAADSKSKSRQMQVLSYLLDFSVLHHATLHMF